MKNKDLNLNIIKNTYAKYSLIVVKHLNFIVIVLVLLVYVFAVFRIKTFVSAEPSSDAQDSTQATAVPTVDQKAIDQVLQLENSSPSVHSLFNPARNNPFNE